MGPADEERALCRGAAGRPEVVARITKGFTVPMDGEHQRRQDETVRRLEAALRDQVARIDAVGCRGRGAADNLVCEAST